MTKSLNGKGMEKNKMVLDVSNLTKTYRSGFIKRKEVAGISALSFSIEAGQIYGLIGPNGSGKTTALLCLLNLLKVNSGTIKIFGEDAKNISLFENVGYMPEEFTFYDFLTGEEFLTLNAVLYGIRKELRSERIRKVAQMLKMDEFLKRKLRHYSRGMLQRIGIAQALLPEPKLLILDEPTSGLDPKGRKLVRELLSDYSQKGTAILLSSHILSDIEKLCQKVAILSHGKVVAEGKLESFLEKTGGYRISFESSAEDIPENTMLLRRDGNKKTVLLSNANELNTCMEWIFAHQGKVVEVTEGAKTLEDFYIELLKE